jgi:hypothetical protein
MKLLRFFLCLIVVASGGHSFGNDENGKKDSAFYFRSSLLPDQLNPFAQPAEFLASKNRRYDFGIPSTDYCCCYKSAEL